MNFVPELAYAVYAIQERASATKETSGPQGAGIQADIAYTLEARHHVQAVAFDTTQITSGENRCNPQVDDPCHPLASGAHAPAIAYRTSGNCGVMEQGDKTTTAVRRLTPKECERLMGLPDDYTRWGLVKGKLVELSDSARYRLLGNGVVINVVEWIARRMVSISAERHK